MGYQLNRTDGGRIELTRLEPQFVASFADTQDAELFIRMKGIAVMDFKPAPESVVRAAGDQMLEAAMPPGGWSGFAAEEKVEPCELAEKPAAAAEEPHVDRIGAISDAAPPIGPMSSEERDAARDLVETVLPIDQLAAETPGEDVDPGGTYNVDPALEEPAHILADPVLRDEILFEIERGTKARDVAESRDLDFGKLVQALTHEEVRTRRAEIAAQVSIERDEATPEAERFGEDEMDAILIALEKGEKLSDACERMGKSMLHARARLAIPAVRERRSQIKARLESQRLVEKQRRAHEDRQAAEKAEAAPAEEPDPAAADADRLAQVERMKAQHADRREARSETLGIPPKRKPREENHTVYLDAECTSCGKEFRMSSIAEDELCARCRG